MNGLGSDDFQSQDWGRGLYALSLRESEGVSDQGRDEEQTLCASP